MYRLPKVTQAAQDQKKCSVSQFRLSQSDSGLVNVGSGANLSRVSLTASNQKAKRQAAPSCAKRKERKDTPRHTDDTLTLAVDLSTPRHLGPRLRLPPPPKDTRSVQRVGIREEQVEIRR